MMDELIQAAAARLQMLWPGCTVYDGAIPLDAGGAYYVGVVRAEQSKGLGFRRRQKAELEVRYYLPGQDGVDFSTWAQSMLDGFRELTDVRERRVTLKQRSALPDGGEGYYAFRFLADVSYVEAEETEEEGAELMEHLEQEETI
ncbi:MAG: DUF6838 family protein [Lawsonibacter sp.]